MPKTPACSPLKRGPSQRFPPSLLISYVESPTQQSYVITTEEISDSDGTDGEREDVIDDTKREYEDVHITPKAPEVTLIRNSDAEGSGGGATTSPKDPATAAGNPKVTVASRFQSARQALADARRRSFQLGERSLSATFQRMRSYSTSSVQCADSQGTAEMSGSNDNNNAPESPISSSQAEEQQQDQTDPEARHQLPSNNTILHNSNPVVSDNQEQEGTEAEPQRQRHQQKKKREPRIRAVSHQSALAKYLPTMFSRTKNTKSPSKASSATMDVNDGSCDNNNSNWVASANIESACDNNGANARRKAKSTSSTVRAKRFPKWMLRQQSEEENESSDNQREHEGEHEDSLRPATRVEQVGSDNSCSEER